MQENQQQSTRLQVINHDCGLIMEAIRRLIDGTWQLRAEDLSYSWELFPKIRSSLKEHVSFEEQIIFPTLPLDERIRHRADHSRLLSILWSAETALIEMQADYFRGLLMELQVMLHEHHQQFAPALEDGGACCSSCHAEEKILLRTQTATL